MNIPRQLAVWSQIAVIDEVAQQRHAKQKTSHKRSEKRRRTKRVTVRLLPAERDALTAAAEEAHVSLSALIRTSALQATQHRKEST
jgi:predicted HicB family RNase H-like nuclease